MSCLSFPSWWIRGVRPSNLDEEQRDQILGWASSVRVRGEYINEKWNRTRCSQFSSNLGDGDRGVAATNSRGEAVECHDNLKSNDDGLEWAT
jgi:hypothetical protein